MYEVITVHDGKSWDKRLLNMTMKDVHALHGYCSLYYRLGEGVPHLFYYQISEEQKIAYPFMKRKIQLPFLKTNETEPLFDIITPYGFGGPLIEPLAEGVVAEFRAAFEDYCKNENIISEFLRFNPMLANHRYLEPFMDVLYDRDSVYIDLTRNEEEMIKHIHKNHLRNIAKAEKKGLTFALAQEELAEEWSEQFYELYKETMDKLQAEQYYYFSAQFVRDFLNNLPKNSFIAAVFLNGEMIAGALCMHEAGVIHYHLGGSRVHHLNLGTNPNLFYNLALWGKNQGFSALHLGAGHRQGDSLFQFKHRFNLGGTAGFYIGKKVHNEEIYKHLCQAWENYYEQPLGSFFPGYRTKSSKIVGL